jgi:hypothetical protein
MCYPTEDMKGRSFSVFWTIFQMGGVIGSIIPICLNWNSKAGNLDDGSVRIFACYLPLLITFTVHCFYCNHAFRVSHPPTSDSI